MIELFPLAEIPRISPQEEHRREMAKRRSIMEPRDPRRRTAPLRRVLRRYDATSEAGVKQELECGHALIKPRNSGNFDARRVRCAYCLEDER